MSLVLMYHRVAAPERDPYRLAVHPDRFTEHVEHLVRLGRTAPLADAVAPEGRGSIAITFDDGYADNAEVAAPLLGSAGLPATWFITAGRLGGRRFWWDRLAESLLGPHPLPAGVDVEITGRPLWLDLRTPEARTTAMRFVHRRLRELPTDVLEAELGRFVEVLGDPPLASDGLTMSVDQLRALAALPQQEIGGHTLTHVQLRGQHEELQRTEVVGSVTELRELLGAPVTSFAYPYGSAGAVGSLAPRLAEEAGCSLAVTTDPGRVGRRNDRYLLPRMAVGNWTGEEFAARVQRVLRAT